MKRHTSKQVRLGLPEKVAWSKDVREADQLCTASQGAVGQAQTGLRSKVEGAGGGDRSYRTRGAPVLTLPFLLFVMGATGGF